MRLLPRIGASAQLKALCVVVLFTHSAAQAMARPRPHTVTLETIPDAAASLNWVPNDPKIVVAMSLLDEDLTHHYASVFDSFAASIGQSHPGVAVQVVRAAVGADAIRALADPNTVGLILVGHTFKTSLGTAAMVASDQSTYPSELLSAATASLRFVALFGCYGELMTKNYQVKYETQRLAGSQTIYYLNNPEGMFRQLFGQVISTVDFFGLDGLGDGIGMLADAVGALDFHQGVPVPSSRGATLTIQVKDVSPAFEPRNVVVNGCIVGVLGADIATSNRNLDYAKISFRIPDRALKSTGCQRIQLRASDLTSGAWADDYLLASTSLRIGTAAPVAKVFSTPIHFGDDAIPYSGQSLRFPERPEVLALGEEQVPMDLDLPEKYRRVLSLERFMGDPGPLQDAWRVLRTQIESDWIADLLLYYKSVEFMDRIPAHWTPLKSRFYSDCL